MAYLRETMIAKGERGGWKELAFSGHVRAAAYLRSTKMRKDRGWAWKNILFTLLGSDSRLRMAGLAWKSRVGVSCVSGMAERRFSKKY